MIIIKFWTINNILVLRKYDILINNVNGCPACYVILCTLSINP